MAIARETERERNTKFPNKKNRQPSPEFLLAPQLWPDPSIFKLPPCEIFRHPNAGNKRNFIPVPVSCNYSQAGTINRTNNYQESANFHGKKKSPDFSQLSAISPTFPRPSSNSTIRCGFHIFQKKWPPPLRVYGRHVIERSDTIL